MLKSNHEELEDWLLNIAVTRQPVLRYHGFVHGGDLLSLPSGVIFFRGRNHLSSGILSPYPLDRTRAFRDYQSLKPYVSNEFSPMKKALLSCP